MRDELDDDFRIAGRLKERSLALELDAQIAEIDQVAIVRDSDEALGGFDADGLRVEERRVARSGVARVADGHVALEPREDLVGENFRHQAHALDVREMRAVGGGDAGGFLPPMLQGVKAEVDLAGGIRVVVDGDYAAVFF